MGTSPEVFMYAGTKEIKITNNKDIEKSTMDYRTWFCKNSIVGLHKEIVEILFLNKQNIIHWNNKKSLEFLPGNLS